MTTVAERIASDLPELARRYRLGDIRGVEYLKSRVNDNYRLETATGAYALRLSSHKRAVEAVAYEHRVMAYLQERGFPTPPLVCTAEGEPQTVVNGSLYRLTRFVHGEPYDPDRPAHLAAIARTLARYHLLMQDYPEPGPKEGFAPVLTAMRRGLADLPWPSADGPSGPWDACPDLRERLPGLRAALQRTIARLEAVPYAALPWLAIYGSCRSGSYIFQGDTVAAMLDYDVGYEDALLLDLGIAVLDFAAIPPEKVALDPEITRRFVAAYREVAALEHPELIPTFVRARILKRELLRYGRFQSRPSEGRVEKLLRGIARLAWLDANEERMVDAVTA
ncbi:MAG: phosphotransferase [Chloroflexi bacterium]|nr:phosphotransferase [Chloroflexota bacterium]